MLFICIGCSGTDVADCVLRAQEAADGGNFAAARSLADEAMAKADHETLSGVQAIKLSLIFVKTADAMADDDGETIGQAIKAYNYAINHDPDSVGLFLATVPARDIRHVKMLLSLVQGLELPDSALVDNEEPSAF